jgi:hypothetical protein
VKVLVVDERAKALYLVLQAVAAGHTVRWYAPESDTGKGFRGFERVDNWVASAGWADVIFNAGCDKQEAKLTQMVQRGYPVWNTPCSMPLDTYKDHAPPTRTFSSVTSAMEFLYQTPERFVLKGDDVDTYESASAADMVAHLRQMLSFDDELMMQDYVEGLQLTVVRGFGPDGWIGPVYEGLAHVGFGHVVEQCAAFDESLGKLTDAFASRNFRGTAMAKCCVTEDGLVIFKVKCGWPKSLVTAAPSADYMDWAAAALKGENKASPRTEISYCVKLETEDSGYPVYGVSRGVAAHAYPLEVALRRAPDMSPDGKIVERDLWVTTGEYVAIVDGYGVSSRQAMRRAMSTVEKIHTAGIEPDIEEEYFDDLKQQLTQAQAQGYLKGFVYG